MDEFLDEGLPSQGDDSGGPSVLYVPEFNHHWDCTKPHNPYAYVGEANPNTLPPTCAVRHAPEFIDGKWPCMDVDKKEWFQVDDLRGIDIWDVETKSKKENTEVVVMDGWTSIEPPSRLHEFIGGAWTISPENQQTLDDEAEAQKRNEAISQVLFLRQQVDYEIVPLQDAVDIDEATEDEVKRLKALKRYRIALSRWQYPEEVPSKP